MLIGRSEIGGQIDEARAAGPSAPGVEGFEHLTIPLSSAEEASHSNGQNDDGDFEFALPPLFGERFHQSGSFKDCRLMPCSVASTPVSCMSVSVGVSSDTNTDVEDGEQGYRAALCLSNLRQPGTQPKPSGLVSSFRSGELVEDARLHQPKIPESHAAQGALKKCEARVNRLDKLNSILEEFANESWSSSDNRQLLHKKLKQNKYYGAIKSKMLSVRMNWIESHSEFLQHSDIASADLGLSDQARKCGPDVAGEVTSLRMLEQQTLTTISAMLSKMSEDVPVCGEEVKAALSRARAAYNPAKKAVVAAVQRTMAEKDSADSSPSRRKKGHLEVEAVCILEDWLVKHFHHPYPTEEEKAVLVKMTGVSLRQINNWLSNARVRIWRPAVEDLHH